MPSLLKQMTDETPTQFWSDSCEVTSLRKAVANGATGATSNPVIVLEAIAADPARWQEVARGLCADLPTGTEEDVENTKDVVSRAQAALEQAQKAAQDAQAEVEAAQRVRDEARAALDQARDTVARLEERLD